jgi:flavin reductase (DIM6/NTAB) family NADH-FMN oxidoreductase RutF
MKQQAILDPDQLRQAMRSWTSGVTILAASFAGERHGMTVSSFTSIALEPPVIMISLQTDSRTHNLIAQSNTFAVTILAHDQREISDRFAGRIPEVADRFEGIETETLVSGAPFIIGGLAYLDCRVTQEITVGTNTLYLAEVVAARGNGSGKALIYHDRKYHNLVD